MRPQILEVSFSSAYGINYFIWFLNIFLRLVERVEL